jgi:alpha-amylase
MVAFRSQVTGEAAANIVTEDNRIAFRRGTKGFYALNNQDQQWQRSFYVGMPQGFYCDVISGEYDQSAGKCTGLTIEVDTNGMANVMVYPNDMVAIHIGQRVPSTPLPTPAPLPASYKRTVIMVHKQTDIGQNIFVRGGLDEASHGCQGDSAASTSKCAVPLVHKTNVSLEDFRSYLSWAQSDRYLDWFGAETDQGTYDGIGALGTPLVWTTNKPGQMGYYPLNTYGDDYWVAEVMMDCDKTDNGWFVFKSFLKPSLVEDTGMWETDIHQDGQCRGDAASATPANVGSNHAALCGAINVFEFSQNGCEIKHF